MELFTPSETRNESGQLVIELQKETIENALREMQQKLMAERREREYRWRAPPKREHYALKLDVANRFLEILQTTSNGVTLQAQVETSTMNVGIEECPDIERTVASGLTGCVHDLNNSDILSGFSGD